MDCENCELREYFAKVLDIHFDYLDCPFKEEWEERCEEMENIEEFVSCSNCIYFEDCENKENLGGCFFGEPINTIFDK